MLVILTFLGFGGLAELALRWHEARKASRPDPYDDRSPVKYFAHPDRQHPWCSGQEPGLRIAVIGDSITAGHGVQFDDTYGARLERLLNLNSGAPPARVDVYARGGYNPTLELQFLDEALSNAPHVVILGLCLNDAEDHRRAPELARWRKAMLPRPPPAWLAGFLRHSRLGAQVYRAYEHVRSRRGSLRYYQRLYAPEYSGWIRLTNALREFRDRTRAVGARLLVVLFPPTTDPNDPLLFIRDRWLTFLEAEGIEYLDLYPVFVGRCPLRMQAIPWIDAHPSEIMHRRTAEVLFETLLYRQIIPPAYFPQCVEQSPEELWSWLRMRMNAPHLMGPRSEDRRAEQRVGEDVPAEQPAQP